MSVPLAACQDNFYVCKYFEIPTGTPHFYIHGFKGIPDSLYKPIFKQEASSVKASSDAHFVIQHSHQSLASIDERPQSIKSILELIAQVNSDITYYKSVIRSFPNLNLRDFRSEDARMVGVITKELGEDKALLVYLENRYESLYRDSLLRKQEQK